MSKYQRKVLSMCSCDACVERRIRGVNAFSYYGPGCMYSMGDGMGVDGVEDVGYVVSPALFSAEVVCRAREAWFQKLRENMNLKAAKESAGLYKYYGPDETVGFDKSKAYIEFCRPEEMEKVVDDRMMYW